MLNPEKMNRPLVNFQSQDVGGGGDSEGDGGVGDIASEDYNDYRDEGLSISESITSTLEDLNDIADSL